MASNSTYEELEKRLERINFWISNCDTKVSFALAFAGVLLAGFVSSSIISNSTDDLIESTKKIYQTATFWEVRIMDLSILVLLGFIVCIITAITYLFRALKGTIDTKVYAETDLTTNSLIYFGSIAEKSFAVFKEEVVQSDAADKENDLLSQIFINSKVCRRKFKLYNMGINFLVASIILFVILIVLFILFLDF